MYVGVLGIGGMGKAVVKRVKTNDLVKGVVAYDVDPQRAKDVAANEGVEAATQLDEVMSDPRVKLVFVTASNAAHRELVLASVKAGKAIMCEKPIATTLPDAREMVDAAEKANVFLQIGFELRYSHLYTRVKQWIDQGLLGEVINTHGIHTIPEYWGSKTWRTDPEATGGMFIEKLCHYVDLPRWWVGDQVTQISSVCAPNIVPYFKVRDNYHTTYRFANGAVSHLTFMMGPPASFHGDPLQNVIDQQQGDGTGLRYLIVGRQGAAEVDAFARTIKRWSFDTAPDRFESTLEETLTWDKEEDHFYIHNTTDQAHDIIRRVHEGQPPMTPARDAYETMRLSFAAERSADLGKPVDLDKLEQQLG